MRVIADSEVDRYRPLAWTLRCLGLIDLCAVFAVVMPREWMQIGHAAAGLGDLPAAPIVGYLTRSASAVYVLHGLLVIYLSLDVRHYWRLIRFFAATAVLHGIVMLSIDLHEGMPLWWTIVEGPGFAARGLVVFAAQAWAGNGPEE